MTRRFASACALLGTMGFSPALVAQEEDGEEDLTGEVDVSTDDLWGDEEEGEQEAEEEEEAPAVGPSKVPWRGTSLSYGHDAALHPYLVQSDLTYNPSYTHSLSLAPGWSFDDHWRLGANVGLSQELTNPDNRTGRYDVWVSSSASVSYAELLTVYETSLSPKLGVTFPTTPSQQVATLYFALSPGFSVARSFEVLAGLSLSWGFSYTKNFHRYREGSSPPQPISCEQATDPNECTTTSMGNRNTNMSFSNALSASLGLTEKLSVGLSASAGQALAYDLTPATLDDALTGDHNGVEDTGQIIGERDGQGGWRYTQGFGGSVGYSVLSYLSASLGISTSGPQLDASSERYNPLLPSRNTSASLSLSIALDTFVQEMGPTRAHGGDARVARRQSESE